MSETPYRAVDVQDAGETPLEVGLELPTPAYGAVGRLVVAGLASRQGATVERIDSLQLALETALQRGAPGPVTLRMRPTADALDVRVGPVRIPEEERGALRRVLSALVEEVETHAVGDDVWLDLRVGIEPLASAGR